jgi:hypothetical protein
VWRWRVSATRFFDVDEFSYMHWVAQVARGQRPYIDFFSYFTPGFMWALAPIYWFSGVSAQVFTTGRVVSFAIFLSILGALSYLWGITRGWKWALLPAVILAFLPMPYDKFLEIRPDNLATLLAIVGVIGEIRGLQTKNKFWWLSSGLAYSASLFVLAKTIPIVMVGAGIAVLSAISSKSLKSLKLLMVGLVGPWILFFLGAALAGHFGIVLYSLTKLPFDVYRSAQNYFMEPNIFFFPNASFYGGNGHTITAGLFLNNAIWVGAILFGVYRLVTPFLTGDGDRRRVYTELLIALIFVFEVVSYVKLSPARHSQYLIPIAVFVAYYGADLLSQCFNWISNTGGYESLSIVLVGFGYLLTAVTQEVNGPKLAYTSAVQVAELNQLIQTVPRTSRVVDLEGRMVFWPEGYPVSSLPIDSTLSFVSPRPVVGLSVYLSDHPAQYIWDGDSGRLSKLNADSIAYIKSAYEPVSGWGEKLWIRK